MTNMSITELADKYRFTVNYMTTFCKKRFGKSPTDLRTEFKNVNSRNLQKTHDFIMHRMLVFLLYVQNASIFIYK